MGRLDCVLTRKLNEYLAYDIIKLTMLGTTGPWYLQQHQLIAKVLAVILHRPMKFDMTCRCQRQVISNFIGRFLLYKTLLNATHSNKLIMAKLVDTALLLGELDIGCKSMILLQISGYVVVLLQ